MQHVGIAAIILSFIVLSACSGQPPVEPARHLPRGLGDMMLGDSFDISGGGVRIIRQRPESTILALETPRADEPVDLQLDSENRITQLHWVTYVVREDQRAAIEDQARQMFGQFLVEEQQRQDGRRLLFTDEMTHYSLDVLDNRVEITIRDAANSEKEDSDE